MALKIPSLADEVWTNLNEARIVFHDLQNKSTTTSQHKYTKQSNPENPDKVNDAQLLQFRTKTQAIQLQKFSTIYQWNASDKLCKTSQESAKTAQGKGKQFASKNNVTDEHSLKTGQLEKFTLDSRQRISGQMIYPMKAYNL